MGCRWPTEVAHCCLRASGRPELQPAARGEPCHGDMAGTHLHGHWAPALNNNDDHNKSDTGQTPEGCFATIILQGRFIALLKKPNILPNRQGRNVYRAHLQCHSAGQVRVQLELRENKLTTSTMLK